jgi:hypothetical protein
MLAGSPSSFRLAGKVSSVVVRIWIAARIWLRLLRHSTLSAAWRTSPTRLAGGGAAGLDGAPTKRCATRTVIQPHHHQHAQYRDGDQYPDKRIAGELYPTP